MIEVTPALLERHDRPGPRYTSYPTAVDFSEDHGPEAHAARLRAAGTRPDDPLSLYVHLPFCESRCSFCACHVVVTKHPEVADAYLGRVISEADLVAEHLGDRTTLVQYHWGGGTPTYYPPGDLVRLHRELLGRFRLADDAEVAVEVDPRVTTAEHLAVLADLGFNRLSVGLQDTDERVQDLIGRHQTADETAFLFEEARRQGFDSINLDLIYGLPGQTEASVEGTLEFVRQVRPSRLAVYSFAYVPWMRPHQKRMDASALPDTEAKFGLLAQIVSSLTAAGYLQIGMDHFALPDDELGQAASDGTLTRNFMGYTTKRDTEIVALGTSGISDIDGSYAQDHRRTASYYQAVDTGVLPVERGIRLSPDDLLRRWVITELMCNGILRFDQVATRFGIQPTEYFERELAELTAPGGLVDEGMAELDESSIRATELGMLFVRRLASVFDAYTGRRPEDRPMFSQTV